MIKILKHNFTVKILIFLFILVLTCGFQADSSVNDDTTEEYNQYDNIDSQEEPDYCPSGCPDPYDTIEEYELDIEKEKDIERNIMNSAVEPSVDPVAHYTFDDTPEDSTGYAALC
ncbi:MAG: hypothetical protein ACLFPF_01290 [Halanaerobiales bacterium]